jgi:hypothetical protein
MKKKPKSIINWQKIKREMIKRETNLDSRFTTKVVKSKKLYSRKRNNDDKII